MGENAYWDKFAPMRSARRVPQFVDMGEFVWVTGGLNGAKSEPSKVY